jgi:ribonuclease Z
MRRRTFAAFLTGFAFTVGMIILIGAGGTVKSPTGTAPDRYVYYPGTEELGKDEIRLIAAGTGMPGARRGQAATCFLVELGDG